MIPNINASFDSKTDQLNLDYDDLTQALFREIVPRLSRFSEREIPQGRNFITKEDLQCGAQTLEHLASNRTVEITGFKAAMALALVGCAVPLLGRRRENADLFAKVMLLLAKVTPVRMTSLVLLPAALAFRGTTASADVQASYSRLQEAKSPHEKFLYLRDGYELGRALRNIPNLSPSMEALLEEINRMTDFFRWAIMILACACVSEGRK